MPLNIRPSRRARTAVGPQSARNPLKPVVTRRFAVSTSNDRTINSTTTRAIVKTKRAVKVKDLEVDGPSGDKIA